MFGRFRLALTFNLLIATGGRNPFLFISISMLAIESEPVACIAVVLLEFIAHFSMEEDLPEEC